MYIGCTCDPKGAEGGEQCAHNPTGECRCKTGVTGRDCTSCKDGYFLNSDTCTICDISCLTCDGSTASDCLSCPSGFLLEAGACVTCVDENCI